MNKINVIDKSVIQIINKIYLLLAFAFPLKVMGQNNFTKAKTFAVVIGIAKYQNSAIPALSYADKDASLFADWLKANKTNNSDELYLKLFINDNATIANIYESFNWLKNKVSKDDNVYIYFSGHGDIETDADNSKGYLLAYNSPSNNYINNAIAVADVNDLANALTTVNNAKVVLITDACHSGKMAGDFYKGRALTAKNLSLVLNNQVRLAACQANELAAEGPGWGGGRGVFSYYLLKGLEGFAKPDSNGNIKVDNLNSYLNASFKTDEGLKIEKHIQHPVIDGNPNFPLATFNETAYLITKKNNANPKLSDEVKSGGLQTLKSLGVQPIDYFFSIADKGDLDSMLNYKNYINLSPEELPRKIVSDYLDKLINLKKIIDSIYEDDKTKYTEQMQIQKDKRDDYIIKKLEEQLNQNNFLVNRFNEYLVQQVHKKCQAMVNAYLNGDLAELEKRQYYNTGNKPYENFLWLMQVAINLTPENNYLYKILNVNKHYLAGLESRMQMAISKNNSDTLLQNAFKQQQHALQLEPYAAYIQNELGNLYMHKKNFDSALYFFNYASALAPTWAIPYSNKIRLFFALQKPQQAYRAALIADSLQQNLSFVNVNVGLVMEKDSNWLAAEAYYLKAISENNIHYLAYERLGYVYINTGDYAKAEKYFIEADLRKNSFAVNDNVFDFGVEAGGVVSIYPPPDEKVICYSLEEKNVKGWRNYIELGKFLPAIIAAKKMDAKQIKESEALFEKAPQLPFNAHYLGKEYYKLNNFSRAEKLLKQAIQNQIPENELLPVLILQLKKSIQENWSNEKVDSIIKNSCLLNNLQIFEYDNLEDYYMLANIYEQNKNLPAAVNLYKKASEIENTRLLYQANYTGFDNNFEPKNYEKLYYEYEQPKKMSAALKIAGLYEQLQKYDSAEITLLNQVKKNRQAGFARQAQLNNDITGVTRSYVNLFWLLANEDLEAATYNFYNRMLAKFPRDGVWYKNAGKFLYERLLLSYKQIPLKEQKYFYTYSLNNPYPFRGGEEGSDPSPEAVKARLTITNQFELPATGEKIKIDMKIYDPLLRAVNYIKLAIRFSGESEPEANLLFMLAHLNSWMGNTDESISNFQKYLAQKPNDVTVRNQFINYLNFNQQFIKEANQLNILYKNNNLLNDQFLKLANYKILSNENSEANALLKNFSPYNAADSNSLKNSFIKILINEKKYDTAISLLKDNESFKINEVEQRDMESSKQVEENENYYHSIYTQIRLYALLKKNKTALSLLKELLDSGVVYEKVLINDPLLKNIEKKKSWKRLLSKYEFPQKELGTKEEDENLWRSSLDYRIPKKQ